MSKIYFFFLFLALSTSVFAQTDSLRIKYDKSIIVQKKFDKENLETYKSNKEFNYSEEIIEEEPTFFERFYNWLIRQFLRLLEWLVGVKYASGILKNILVALPYIITAVVLFLIIKFFLKVNANAIISNAKNKPIVTITEEEELIKNKDILKLVQKAIAQKNYRLAVRYSYLNVLKQLEEKEIISWEQQKTNKDYIQEISEKNIKNSFEKLTRLYDFVWYGKFQINHIEFAKVQANFEKATILINKK